MVLTVVEGDIDDVQNVRMRRRRRGMVEDGNLQDSGHFFLGGEGELEMKSERESKVDFIGESQI